ncbi:MAG: hypothetical protein N3A69_11910, partial [Leptospiraceae bacterium]|nr:hypothetical protein [Leptospiraceae bacterium]
MPHLNSLKIPFFKSYVPVVFFLFAAVTSSSKATENLTPASNWNLEKLELCLSKCKLFEAEKYNQKDYSNLLEKAKQFISLPSNHESYLVLSQNLESSCVNILLESSSNYFKDELDVLLNKLKIAESAYSEVLARSFFSQGKQLYNESLLIQAEVEGKKKLFLKEPKWNSNFESLLNEQEILYSKLQKGKESVDKSVQLSLSQTEQLITAILDVERTFNYALNYESDSEPLQRISDHKVELKNCIEKI